MNHKRLIRDFGILGLFCVGFFLVTRAINLLGEENLEPVQVEFSETRRMADRQFTRKDYRSAIRFLSKLTNEDEFNSHAWYKLGDCYASLYDQSKRPSLADPTPYSEDNQKKQKELADKAIAAYSHVIDYPRYRSPAMIRIAAIHTLERNNDAALDILEQLLSFKSENQTPYFIQREPFLSLANEPRYIAIKKEFLRNASKNGRERRADGRLGVSGSPDSPPQESGDTSK